MKKCKAFRPLLLAAFIVNFCLVSSLFSQVSGTLNQNSINDVSISKEEGKFALVFQGNIKSLAPSDVTFSKETGTNRFTISLKNSLWDSNDLNTITRQFGADDPVSSISITNDISSELGSEGAFVVMIDVDANQDFAPELASPVSPTEIKIWLKGNTSRVLATKSVAQEREEAARMQKEIQKEKQTAQMTAKESVEAILQQYRKPSIMQVSIFNASGLSKRAYGLSVYLDKIKKEYIEESLGMKMEIVNISNAKDMSYLKSTIYFRNNYLKPALFLAKLIKGDQRVIPLLNQDEKQGVDIEIYLGTDYK